MWVGLPAIKVDQGRLTHCASRRERLYPAILEPTNDARDHGRWALSSAVEHYLDMVGVRGSIPLAPTTFSMGYGTDAKERPVNIKAELVDNRWATTAS